MAITLCCHSSAPYPPPFMPSEDLVGVTNFKLQELNKSLSRGWLKFKKGRMMWTSLPSIYDHA
jgi:hypothetical protein